MSSRDASSTCSSSSFSNLMLSSLFKTCYGVTEFSGKMSLIFTYLDCLGVPSSLVSLVDETVPSRDGLNGFGFVISGLAIFFSYPRFAWLIILGFNLSTWPDKTPYFDNLLESKFTSIKSLFDDYRRDKSLLDLVPLGSSVSIKK